MPKFTVGADEVLRQDGQTADEWLASLFEAEVCGECGWDADKHTVIVSPVGFFARCDDPIPETLSEADAEAKLERRLAISTEG